MNNYYYCKTLDNIKIENYEKRIDKSYQHKQNIKNYDAHVRTG